MSLYLIENLIHPLPISPLYKEKVVLQKRWEKHPTYKGVEVCGEWLDFQQFACWYYENSVDNSIKYEIDKDIYKEKVVLHNLK